MRVLFWLSGILGVALRVFAVSRLTEHPTDHDVYQYTVVHFKPPVGQIFTQDELVPYFHTHARQLVEVSDLELVGQVGPLNGHYLFRRPRQKTWMEKAHALMKRHVFRRQHVETEAFEPKDWLGAFQNIEFAIPQELKRLHKRTDMPTSEAELIHQQLGIGDPLFPRQWHLFNRQQTQADLNVTAVWADGVSGDGVNVAIIDDGIDMYHADIAPNFYLQGSYDFNSRRKLPIPTLNDDTHGTRCAGEIAAARNSYCGVGVAWKAKVAGLRLLSGEITDADEINALTYDYANNHVYSCSWGPSDDGGNVAGPNEMIRNAFITGTRKGRNGLGSIYVFASGNGGNNMDECNYDGYANSIYTIAVGAIDRNNLHQVYSESCSALLTTTYSSNNHDFICTTDVRPANCTDRHQGTSAAAPLVSGMIALTLSVRPDLNWRDIQHLIIRASEAIQLTDPSWGPTHTGRMFSNKYGYGRLDAYRLVKLAKEWRSVGPQVALESPYFLTNAPITEGPEGITFSTQITKTKMTQARLKRLEHVTVTVWVEHAHRGDLEFRLVSPNGIISILGAVRGGDGSQQGFSNWTFTTVKHFYEPPEGTWHLRIVDNWNVGRSGTLRGWRIKLWGEAPVGTFPDDPETTDKPSPNPPSQESKTLDTTYVAMGVLFILAIAGAIGVYILRKRKRAPVPKYRIQDLELAEIFDQSRAPSRSSSLTNLKMAVRSKSPSPLRQESLLNLKDAGDEQ